MEDKELSHEESLKVIHGMIDLAKNKINDSGFHFLLWGILVIIASISQYLMINNGVKEESNLVWIIMSLLGVPIACIYEYRRRNRDRTQNKFDKIYGYLWMGFGITLFLTIFVSISNNVNPVAFILLLVGLATFVSGFIYHFTPLIVGSFVFWGVAAICPQLDANNQLLANALAVFIGYIVPGILLWKKSKK